MDTSLKCAAYLFDSAMDVEYLIEVLWESIQICPSG